jgi:leucyl-tRNA synthetase
VGHETTLAYEPWPSFDPALATDDTVEIGVQVGGKTRGTVRLAKDADEAAARAAAESNPDVARFLEGKAVKKFIYVPARILNFVVG